MKSGEFLDRLHESLLKTGLLLMANVIKLLAKIDFFIRLGLAATEDAPM